MRRIASMPSTPRHHEVDQDDVGRQARDGLRPPPRRRRPRRRPRCPPGGRGTSRRPWRTTAWSSAMRTRITAGTSSRTVVPAPGARLDRSASPPSARARSSIDVSPSRRERSAGLVGVEAAAVVGDREHEAAVASRRAGRRRGRRRRGASAFCSASWAMRKTSPSRSAPRLGVALDARARSASPCTRRSTSTCLRSAVGEPFALERPAGAARRSASAAPPSPRARARCTRRELRRGGVGVAVEQRGRGLGGRARGRTASA